MTQPTAQATKKMPSDTTLKEGFSKNLNTKVKLITHNGLQEK